MEATIMANPKYNLRLAILIMVLVDYIHYFSLYNLTLLPGPKTQ